MKNIVTLRHPGFVKPRTQRGGRAYQIGAELVEMAIMLGFFIILVIMILEMMMMLYAYNTTGALAREAVRYAVVRGNEAAEDSTRSGDAPADQAKIQSYVNNKKFHSGAFGVTATWPEGKDIGDPVQITVSHVYEPIVVPGALLYTPTFQSTAQGVIVY